MIPTAVKQLQEKISTVFYDGRVVPAHTEYEHYYKDSEDGAIYASVTTKTSLLSRKYYKQMAADKAVDLIEGALLLGTPLDKMLLDSARVAHVADLEKAGKWGTHGHDIVDKYVDMWITTGERPSTPIQDLATEDTSPQGICAAISASKMFDEYDMFPVISEKKIISKKHSYGGTLDSLWFIGEPMKNRDGDMSCKHDWFEKKGNKLTCLKCDRKIKLVLTLIDLKTSNNIWGRGEMGKIDYCWQVSAYSQSLKEMCGISPKKHWILRLDKSKPDFEIGVIVDIKESLKGFLAINFLSNLVRAPLDPIVPLKKKNIIML